MQFSPHQLKEKLVKALDKDNNVVDMQGVLAVIALLEKYTLTREDLEQTRLGKIINELRKKTDNRDVAKRSKNLVRQWQALINTPVVNGEGVAARGGLAPGSKPASPALSRLSPASTCSSKPASPAITRVSPKLAAGLSPKLSCYSQNVRSPKLATGHRPVPANGQSNVSPLLCRKTGTVSSSPALRLSVPCEGKVRSPAVVHKLNSNHVNQLPTVNRCVPDSSKTHKAKGDIDGSASQTLSKTNAANKKRRRPGHSTSPDAIPLKKQILGNGGEPSFTSQNGTKLPVKDYHKSSLDSVHLKRISSAPDLMNGAFAHARKTTSPTTNHSNCTTPSLIKKTKTSHDLLGANCSTPVSSRHADIDRPSLSAKRNANLSLKTPEPMTSEKFKEKLGFAKTPKVKTTAQLIAELQAKSGSGRLASATITKITTNQIEKEHDDIGQSVVPAGAKPRPRRKPGTALLPPSTPTGTLSQTKTEMVRKFLQTSITPSTSDLSSPFKMDPFTSSSQNESLQDVDTEADVDIEGVDSPTRNDSKSPPHTVSKPPEMDINAIYDMLPPLDVNSINWNEDSPEPQPVEVTSCAVDQLHTEHWIGVNGNLDSEGQWSDATDLYPMPSYQGDLLYILPYINIDD